METGIASAFADAFCIYTEGEPFGLAPLTSRNGSVQRLFSTEEEARRQIALHYMRQLQCYLDGECDFEEASVMNLVAIPVTVHLDGTFSDEWGNEHSVAT